MGGGREYDTVSTRQLVASHRASGQSYMRHHTEVKRTGRVVVHPSMDVKRRNRMGEIVRESLDLPDLPASVPIVVLFDTTGSMSDWPEQFVLVLADLMEQLRADNAVENPHLMFGAINDFQFGSAIPSQIGQFERTDEINNTITNIYLEGRGGDGLHESHQLSIYFLARRSRLACLARGKKGHLFIVSDEPPYDSITRTEAEQVFGDEIPRDIPTSELMRALQELYHVTWIWPNGTHNGSNQRARQQVSDLVGAEGVVRIETANALCNAIVTRVIQTERAHAGDTTPIVPSGIEGLQAITQTPNATASPAASEQTMPDRPMIT